MNSEKLSKLSDEELLEVAEHNKPSPLVDAFFIGFLVGIIIFGLAVSAWSFFALPLLFVLRGFLKKPKQHEALQKELKKRNLNE